MSRWLESRSLLVATIIALLIVIANLLTVGPPYQQHEPPREQGSQNPTNKGQQSPATAVQIECDPNCTRKETHGDGHDSRLTRLLNKTFDDPLALFTAALAVATLGLVVVVLVQVRDARKVADRQAKETIRSLGVANSGLDHARRNARNQFKQSAASIKVAQRTADAAKKAADATAAADRPHLLMIELHASGLLQAANAAGQVELTLAFKFQNFGKSPAFLNAHSFDLNWDATLPTVPPYRAPVVVPFIVAPVTGIHYRPPVGGVFIPKPIADDIAAGRRHLHFFGKLDYEDILDAPHIFRYCYRMVFQGNDATIAFRPTGPGSYWEYT